MSESKARLAKENAEIRAVVASVQREADIRMRILWLLAKRNGGRLELSFNELKGVQRDAKMKVGVDTEKDLWWAEVVE